MYLRQRVSILQIGIVMMLVPAIAIASDGATLSASDAARGDSQIFKVSAKKLPKIFDWDLYKRSFNKSYSNVREEIVRKRFLLASSLQIFIHNILFKWQKTSYYLAQNHFSDRSPKEIKSMYDSFENLPDSMEDDDGDEKKDDDGDDLATILEHNEHWIDEATIISGFQSIIDSRSANYEWLKGELANQQGHKLVRRSVDEANQLEVGAPKVGTLTDDHVVQTQWSSMLSKLQKKFNKNRLEIKLPIDWRQSGCIGKPKNQKICGSCYAFATIALMEWAHCNRTGELVRFSEQYMIDCGEYIGLDRCNGGDMGETAHFFINYGLELEDNYPYSGNNRECPFEKDANTTTRLAHQTIRPIIQRWWIVPFHFVRQMLTRGPLPTTLRAVGDFHHYGGNVHTGHNCVKGTYHSMLLVGDGIENGIPYWLFRNSHGAEWGEAGYFKMSKSAPSHCFSFVVFAKLKFATEETRQ